MQRFTAGHRRTGAPSGHGSLSRCGPSALARWTATPKRPRAVRTRDRQQTARVRWMRNSTLPSSWQGRAVPQASITVRISSNLHPFSVLYLAKKGVTRTLVLGCAKAHRRRAEDIVVVLDALQRGDEAVGCEIPTSLLQRQDHQF